MMCMYELVYVSNMCIRIGIVFWKKEFRAWRVFSVCKIHQVMLNEFLLTKSPVIAIIETEYRIDIFI